MAGAELGLAVIATIDLCLKYGNELIKFCAHFKNADTELAHRVLRIKASCIRASYHLEFLRKIAETLPEEYLQMQEQILLALEGTMKMTGSLLRSLLEWKTTKGTSAGQIQIEICVKRMKYALREGSLTKAIADLETWQGLFDPSWYLIIKAAMPQIDVELAKYSQGPSNAIITPLYSLRNALQSNLSEITPIWLREEGLDDLVLTDLAFSSTKLASRPDGRLLILESFACSEHSDLTVLTRDIRDLARKLSMTDPAIFGLLNCKGVVQRGVQTRGPKSFCFVFKMPHGLSHANSLRGLLLLGEFNQSLSLRVEIALQLTKSVGYIHTYGFVHKNVRPENILMLAAKEKPIGQPYLVGFDYFRDVEGVTCRIGDLLLERNLYRHPSRQGAKPEAVYVMQHDIYSLGVCLLEIGLWQSFINYDPIEQPPCLAPILGISEKRPDFQTFLQFKDIFLSLTRTLLPTRMGTKYAQVVETCLTCLDPENADFGDEQEFHDEHGILVGIRFIEKILKRLSMISV